MDLAKKSSARVKIKEVDLDQEAKIEAISLSLKVLALDQVWVHLVKVVRAHKEETPRSLVKSSLKALTRTSKTSPDLDLARVQDPNRSGEEIRSLKDKDNKISKSHTQAALTLIKIKEEMI